jgi:hypothetical protein
VKKKANFRSFPLFLQNNTLLSKKGGEGKSLDLVCLRRIVDSKVLIAAFVSLKVMEQVS